MIFLAFRHLFSRKRQTLLTFLGILLGSTAYVVISGFFLGFQGFLIEQLINNDAHIHVSSREDILTDHVLDQSFYSTTFAHVFWISPPSGRKDSARINNPPEWNQRLSSDSRVEAFSPQLSAQVILRQAKSAVTATLVGCYPNKQMQVSNITDSMQEGKFSDLGSGGNRLIVGEGLLEKLGARVSQTVQLSTGNGESVPFKIVGYFRTGSKLIDDVRAFGALADVQKINGTPNEINDISIRLKDYNEAANIATNWASVSIDRVKSWDQLNANFFSVFKIQNTTRYLMIFAILLVAGFGIYNVLNMTVTQKQREIAILRSMGFDQGDIVTLFFSQGFILGIFGGLMGLVLGYWICRYLQTVPFAGGPLGGAGFLHIAMKPEIYVQAMALALISSSLASILPALSASRLTPIEIIRAGSE